MISGRLPWVGVAGRQKELRMCPWWRFEQQSTRMALATVTHLSNDEMNDAMGQTTPPSAAFFWMFDEEDAEPGV